VKTTVQETAVWISPRRRRNLFHRQGAKSRSSTSFARPFS